MTSSGTPDFIFDAHLDIAYNGVAFGRDFRVPAWKTRQREGKFPGHPYDDIGVATVGLPNLLLGRVGLAFATLWVSPPTEPYMEGVSYETPQQAYRNALRQYDYYQKLFDEEPRVRLVTNQAQLSEVLASWGGECEFDEHLLGLILLIENADSILEPQQVYEWYERGVRVVGPAWRATRYSGGTGQPGNLTKLGFELLEAMADLNMILDVSHMAEYAFYQAVEAYPGSIIASHSNPNVFVNTDRHLSNDMIRRLVERDGVIGTVLYNSFLRNNWVPGRDRKRDVTVNIVLDVIDHVCQIAGSADHSGIGTDWDGGFGWESIPVPFDTHIDLWDLRRLLLERYEPEDVSKILSGNFLRILKRALPE